MGYSTVQLSGVAAGVGLLILAAMHWWLREGHKAKAIVPFLLSWTYGMLAVISTASAWSALGAVAWLALWASNVAGYAGLVWGVGGTDQSVTRAHQIVLTSGGYVVLFLVTLVLLALWKWSKRVPNIKLAAGFLSGCAMGLSGSVAGAAAVPLASGANLLGVGFTRMFT
jgi:hypothetical protein